MDVAQAERKAMNGDDKRVTLLHLAVDYSTPQRPKTTTAIEWMLDALPEFDNVVVAYRRTPRPCNGQESRVPDAARRVYDFPYRGLPFGIGLHRAMRVAARRTITLLERDGIRPQAIHAHKLTFEGIAGWYVARHFGVPLLLSLRGEVETKVFRNKPLLRPFLRRMSASAFRLYFVSAWFRDEFHRHVPEDRARERLLPNIVRNVRREIVPKPANDALVSVFNLDTWKRKGVRWLIEGVAIAAQRNPAIRLDIIGGGGAAGRGEVERLIARHGMEGHVRLVGPLPNGELLARLADYRALALPSLNETFGMVYVEALFAGIPVLFTRGTAIDGYLDDLDVSRSVPPRDPPAIADALLTLWDETDAFRARITAAAPQLHAIFAPEIALERYRADIAAAT
jgi:glycosyltransferase involved in cell wall biosynthesis